MRADEGQPAGTSARSAWTTRRWPITSATSVTGLLHRRRVGNHARYGTAPMAVDLIRAIITYADAYSGDPGVSCPPR
jgi:hypothetical protein